MSAQERPMDYEPKGPGRSHPRYPIFVKVSPKRHRSLRFRHLGTLEPALVVETTRVSPGGNSVYFQGWTVEALADGDSEATRPPTKKAPQGTPQCPATLSFKHRAATARIPFNSTALYLRNTLFRHLIPVTMPYLHLQQKTHLLH